MTIAAPPVPTSAPSEGSPASGEVPPGTVVVGIDGSDGAARALERGIDQAVREHRGLTVVHSGRLATGGSSMWLGQPGVDVAQLLEDIRVAGLAVLDAATRRAHERCPELVVHQVLSSEDARTALVGLAADAATVVVGSRGRGPVASVLLGSVSVFVAKHASCPVVVDRPGPSRASQAPGAPEASGAPAPLRGVVVDVEGSRESRLAIEFAYRTASSRSLPLVAVRVFGGPSGCEEGVVADGEPGLEEERLVLSEATAGMREEYPDVDDRLVLARGAHARELVRVSRDADLLVVGSRPPSVIEHVVPGSVAVVVEHALCSVAVVPDRRA